MDSHHSRVGLAAAAVLVVYIALAATWVFTIPLGGGIDEPRHLRYVQIVADEGRLPTPAEKQEAISHHPPLHYLIVSPVYLASRGMGKQTAWYALRLAQIPIGAVTLVLIFAMLRRMLPDRPSVAVVAMASVALLPHFQLVSAVLSNDITTAMFSTLMLYFVVRAIREPERPLRHALLAGLAGGAAVMTKMNGLIPMPAALVAVALAALAPAPKMELGRAARALRTVVAFVATFALTGGLWIGRHLSTWGTLESDPAWPARFWPVHTFGAKLVRAVEGLYRSTWAQVGWLPGSHSPPPPTPTGLWPRPDLETPILVLMLPVAVVGLIGTVSLAVSWLRSDATRARGLATVMLVAAWGLAYGAIIHRAIYRHPGSHEAGRYALPAVAAVVSLLTIGPMALPRRWTIVVWVFCLALLAVMTAVSFWEMHTYLVPTFAQ